MNIKMYMCVITNEEGEAEVLTSNCYMELMSKVVENIMDTFLDDYPALSKYKIANSIDFISEYDEEEYRDILNKILYFLEKNRIEYKAKFIGIDQEINNGNLINVLQDTM